MNWMLTERDADGEAWRRAYFRTIRGALDALPRWVEDRETGPPGQGTNAHLRGLSWELTEISEEDAELNPPFHDRSVIERVRRLEDLEASYAPEDLIW